MVVFKYDYLKEQDIGALLGIKNIGINTRDVTISETKGTLLTNDVLIKHLSIKSNQLYPAHPSPSTQIVLVTSGKASFSSSTGEFELESGDIVHLHTGEVYSIKNLGDNELKSVCFCI